MKKQKYSRLQLSAAYFNKQSKLYEEEGYKYAEKISNRYLKERILAFLFDTSIMLSPVLIWCLLMLLLFANLIPVTFMTVLQIIIAVLLVISSLTFNTFIIKRTHGQTLGKFFYGLKIVRKDRHEASASKLVMRELWGSSIPFLAIVLILTFLKVSPWLNIVAVMGYWLINFVVLLIHPRHLSIVDIFLGTRIVVLHPQQQARPQEVVKVVPTSTTIDLHMHSTFSDDGEFNVEELFQMAKAKGMKVISITDHNCAKANLIAERMSKLYHVDYIPGIEIDCTFEGKNMHVLGYFIKYNSELYSHIENDNLIKEKKASLERVKKFEEYSGMEIDVDALLEKNRLQTITGEMIAEQILNNSKYKDYPLLQPYISGNRSDMPYVNFYWDYFSQGKPCYVDIKYPKLEDVIDVIKLTDGVPVIAHPFQTFKDDMSFLNKVLDKGIEGIEVFSSYHSNTEMAQLLKIAREKKMLITAGSDFHGKTKPIVEIGGTKCPLEAEKLVEQFIKLH